MRILLDECLDERLRHSFSDHNCETARHAGLAGLKNGKLLDAAEARGFSVLLTVDQGFAYEQNLAGRQIAIIIFRSKSNRLKDVLLLVPACLELLKSVQPGDVLHLPQRIW